MELGIIGKPNVGKSTFFSASTLAAAEIAAYPFTTIEANRGVAYVRKPCPHTDFGIQCTPRNSLCDNGTRLIPVEMLDVAGLVPDAWMGKGLGNKFLDDLSRASSLIHVIDASGGTDAEGNIVPPGTRDPVLDIEFMEREIALWIKGIIEKGFQKIARQAQLEGMKIERALHERLTGLGITEAQIYRALHKLDVPEDALKWGDEDMERVAFAIRERSKPIIIAANKADAASDETIERLMTMKDRTVIPTCAECELALRRADKAGLVRYSIGSSSFEILQPEKLSDGQKKALHRIQEFMDRFGDTGVQRAIETAIFGILDLMAVYPVEDENHLTDKEGRVLPDAYLVPKGTNARDLAYIVHTDLGDNFIRAIDARTKRVIGHDHELKDGDVITIVARA